MTLSSFLPQPHKSLYNSTIRYEVIQETATSMQLLGVAENGDLSLPVMCRLEIDHGELDDIQSYDMLKSELRFMNASLENSLKALAISDGVYEELVPGAAGETFVYSYDKDSRNLHLKVLNRKGEVIGSAAHQYTYDTKYPHYADAYLSAQTLRREYQIRIMEKYTDQEYLNLVRG